MKIEPIRVGNLFASMTKDSLGDQWRTFVFSVCEWQYHGVPFLTH